MKKIKFKNMPELPYSVEEAVNRLRVNISFLGNDIKKIMDIYKIGKAPLSLALGFGEVTIPRYLEGQVPSK